jgi:hypothetical protein
MRRVHAARTMRQCTSIVVIYNAVAATPVVAIVTVTNEGTRAFNAPCAGHTSESRNERTRSHCRP